MKLEVGKTYLNREGNKKTITSKVYSTTFPYRDHEFATYREDGRYGIPDRDHRFDLVEEVADVKA